MNFILSNYEQQQTSTVTSTDVPLCTDFKTTKTHGAPGMMHIFNSGTWDVGVPPVPTECVQVSSALALKTFVETRYLVQAIKEAFRFVFFSIS